MKRHALIVGCGYLGSRVARTLAERGDAVTVTTRSPRKLSDLRDLGFDAELLELASSESDTLRSKPYDIVVYSVAAGRGGDGKLCYLDGPLEVLRRLEPRRPDRFLYVSSTGVYAQSDGAEVDETSPALSETGNSGWIRKGEEALLSRGATVLRLGGLYGPQRSPLDWLERPDFRERLKGSGGAYMNWIHVDDAATAVARASERGRPGEIYLIVDGSPVRREDFYGHAARLAGVEPPRFTDDPADRGKRCRNRKMIEEFGIDLLYPGYRPGLRSLVEERREEG